MSEPSIGAIKAPGVYGLIIGPKYDSTLDLPHVAVKAEAMRTLITRTYPKAQIWPLIGPSATVGNVKSCLQNDIPNVPEFSLVILYFVGHGERNTAPSGLRGDLNLLLVGSKLNDYLGTSITINDIYNSIKSTRKTFIMAFIDSCFSGASDPLNVDFSDETLSRLGIRAFMICSSSANEESQNGLFTDTLIDVWKQSLVQKNCRSPSAFAKDVQTALLRKKEFMTSNLVFGRYIDCCTSELGQPSMLLAIQPDKRPQYTFQIRINSQIDPDIFDINHDPIFVRTVPRRDLLVSVKCQGTELLHTTAKAKNAVNDVVRLKVTVPSLLADRTEAGQKLFAEGSLEVAKFVEAFGGNAAPEYMAAARDLNSARPGYDTLPLLQKVVQIGDPASEEFKIAKIVTEKRPLAVSASNVALANKIRAIGGYQIAADFDLALAQKAQGPGAATRLLKSAIASLYAAGNKQALLGLLNDDLVRKVGASNTVRTAARKTDENRAAAVTAQATPSTGKDVVTTAGFSADSNAISIKPDAATKAIPYSFTSSTAIVDSSGNTLPASSVPPDTQAVIYYTKNDNSFSVQKMIILGPGL